MNQRQFYDEKEKVRFETFIDAILAIILTILVLEFRVPEKPFTDSIELQDYLKETTPIFVSYFISFSTIIILWLDHHNLFRLLKRIDNNIVFLNFIFIFLLATTPFFTALAGRNYKNADAIALLAAAYLLMNLSFTAIWIYVMKKNLISTETLKSVTSKIENPILMLGIILTAICIPLAYVNTIIPFILLGIILLLHAIRIYKH